MSLAPPGGALAQLPVVIDLREPQVGEGKVPEPPGGFLLVQLPTGDLGQQPSQAALERRAGLSLDLDHRATIAHGINGRLGPRAVLDCDAWAQPVTVRVPFMP